VTAIPVDLRVEHHHGEPLGVDTARPRLSWRVETDAPGWHQARAEIDAGVATWTSDGRASVLVPWQGSDLAAGDRVTWRVRVTGDDGATGEWSEPHSFEVGLLSPDDWTAPCIGADWDDDAETSQPAHVLRRRFTLDAVPDRARLHAAALGIYEATLNGERVGDHWLAPGWTAYRHRIHAQTYDVTSLLRQGDNELVVTVADGWHRGFLGFATNRNVYGDRLGLVAQLIADGTTVVTTD
jgi:alpha-L-rhamnosidase